MRLSRLVDVIAAVATTKTSEAIPVKYAKKVVLMLTRSAHDSGSGAFTVSGSVDEGTTHVDLEILRDNAVGVLTLVDEKVLSANGTKLISIDLEGSGFCFDEIKVTVTRTTGGTHAVKAYIIE